MGRQPFLTRLAFGRSPFEPSQEPQPSVPDQENGTVSEEANPHENVQREFEQRSDAITAKDSDSNRYVQQYDERGNPVNPRAHAYGRRLRHAQNDVLSAIGVVERRPSPDAHLSGATQERLAELEEADAAGVLSSHTFTNIKFLCSWWVNVLEDRILTFRAPDHLSLLQIVALQYQTSGRRFLFAGALSQYTLNSFIENAIIANYVIRPLDRLLRITHATGRTKSFFRRWKAVTKHW